jgi:signal transduction histidine kinase/CheY-like chemotaxis protein
MSFKSKAYLVLILTAGVLSLVRYLPEFRPNDPFRFTAYLILALLASGLKVNLPGIRGTMSVLFLFLLIGVIELSLSETLVIAVAASFVQSFWHARERPKLIHLSFNVASLVIATISTEFAYTAPSWFKPDIPVPARLAAAAAMFFVGNTLTVAVIIGLTEKKSVVQTWRTCYFWSFPYYFGGACVAGLYTYLTQIAGWQASILTLPIIYLVYRSYRMYLDRLEEGRAHAEQLEAAAKRLNSVLESTTDCVLAISSDSLITYANHRARSRLFKDIDPVGSVLWNIFPKLADAGFRQEVDAALAENKSVSSERFLPELDAWFEIHVNPSLEGVAFYLKDVTEKRELGEQLRQAQKMEAIGRLAGGIAHDFNNLLTIILGFGQIVADDLSNTDAKSNMAEVIKAGERASALTQRLLAFTRKQILEPEILDLNMVVTGMEGMLKRLIGEDVQITVQLSPHIGSIRADHHQLEQVVMNLAVNARDAMPAGGKLVISTGDTLVETSRAAVHGRAGGRYSMLTVRDTGSGMDAETKAKIFEPFFTTKGSGKGTGLGLSMVYGIVQQSGGFLAVQSELGVGSSFEIYLPCVTESSTAPRIKPKNTDITGCEKILVIEDEDAVRQLVESLLTNAGYTVLALDDAGHALRLSKSDMSDVDLLVTDMVMPGMSGPDVAAQLVQVRPELKVLYVSGYTEHPSITEGKLPDRTSWLQKPFTRDELLSKVRTALNAN